MVKRSTTALDYFFKRNVNDKGRLVHGTFPRAVKEFCCCESESSLVTAWLQLRESILCDMGMILLQSARKSFKITTGYYDILWMVGLTVMATSFEESFLQLLNVSTHHRRRYVMFGAITGKITSLKGS